MNELAASPQIKASDIDRMFDELKVYVVESWSNLEVARRLDAIHQLVQPVGHLRAGFKKAQAVIETSGSYRVINNRLAKLQADTREHVCLYSLP